MTNKPTHKVSLYGVRCYMDDTTGEMWGCIWLWDKLLTPAIWLHWTLQAINPAYSQEGFLLRVIEEYEKGKP